MTSINTNTFRATALTLLAATALSMPASAGTVGISRCSSSGASGTPVLHVVNGGQRFILPVGENGLTSQIVMSERRAMAWADASGLFPAGTIFVNYNGYLCGMMIGNEPQPEPEAAPAPSFPSTDTVIETTEG